MLGTKPVRSLCLALTASAVAQAPPVDPYQRFEARVLHAVREAESALDCRISLSFRDMDYPLTIAYPADEITGVQPGRDLVETPFGSWKMVIRFDGLGVDAVVGKFTELSQLIYDERKDIVAELPDIQHSFKIDFTPSRVALIEQYAEAHYSDYYETTTGSPVMPGLTFDPKVLVVHYTAGTTLQAAFNTFRPETLGGRPYLDQAGAVNVGIQFIVDRDGTIYQVQPDNYFGRHVIGLNHSAIGFENIGSGDISAAALNGEPQDDDRLTFAQLEANIKLIRYLRHKYPDVQVFLGHSEYRDLENPEHPAHALFHENDPDYRTVKSDPGPRFMQALRAALTDLLEPGQDGQIFRPASRGGARDR